MKAFAQTLSGYAHQHHDARGATDPIAPLAALWVITGDGAGQAT